MELLKKRLRELAEKSYRSNQYLFTHFLNMAEMNAFYEIQKEISYIPYTAYGGAENCERLMLRFGSEELLGYEEPFPICCVLAEPLIEKFADTLTHRDFLGAVMNLGIGREVVGDIAVKGKKAYIFCTEKIAPYIMENLVQVKHTSVQCTILEELPDILKPTLEKREITAASERIDAVIGKLCSLSRSQSIQVFREKKVFVNGKQCENNSYQLKSADVVTVRGFGKFIYDGFRQETRKGKMRMEVSVYSSPDSDRKKKTGVTGTILGMALLLTITGCGSQEHLQGAAASVMQVNDYAVSQEEYDFFCSLYKAQAASDFWSAYEIDVSGSEDGWDIANEDGLTGREYLEQMAEEAIIRYAVIWSEAKEYGISVPDNYEALEEKLDEVNESESGVTGYGMNTWSMQNLFSYLYTDMEDQLKEALAEKEFSFTEEEMKECYESMDHSSIALRGDLDAQISLFYFPIPEDLQTEEQKQCLSEIAQGLEMGEKPETLYTAEDETQGELVALPEHEISSEEMGRDDMLSQSVLSALYECEEGDVITDTFAGVRCVFRVNTIEKEGGDFESSKEKIYAELVNQTYLAWIEDAVNDAQIVR